MVGVGAVIRYVEDENTTKSLGAIQDPARVNVREAIGRKHTHGDLPMPTQNGSAGAGAAKTPPAKYRAHNTDLIHHTVGWRPATVYSLMTYVHAHTHAHALEHPNSIYPHKSSLTTAGRRLDPSPTGEKKLEYGDHGPPFRV